MQKAHETKHVQKQDNMHKTMCTETWVNKENNL